MNDLRNLKSIPTSLQKASTFYLSLNLNKTSFFILFFSVKTTAKRVGDDLVINGSKMWITNAFQADWICLLANDTACAGKPIHMNKSLICLPMDTKG